MKEKLSTQPYKGARDFYPEDMRIRNYIFDTWKRVAKRYGFEEYDAPLLESFDIYAAKSGEELVSNQLYSFEDRGGRKIAVRPEKTPSVARMIAAKVKELPKPIKWFNVGNCWRFEKPQRGRGREFYQFDCDIFGIESVAADAEVFSIPIDVMKELGANESMFEIKVANRRLTEFYLADVVKLEGSISEEKTQMYKVAKIVDAKAKMSAEEFVEKLKEAGLSLTQIEKLSDYISADVSFVEKYKDENLGAKEIVDFFEIMKQKSYAKYFKFSPEIMRGLDYYTGIVVEQFDLNPENNRSMYGGGRYDGLANEFIDQNLPGVGFAMGDVTLLEFLKGWDLLPELETDTEYLVTLWQDDDPKYLKASQDVAQKLRSEGKNVSVWLEAGTKLDKQLKYANRKGIPNVVIIGDKELEDNSYTVKDMKTGKQEIINF